MRMLDEILLALHGYSGDIVLERNGMFEVMTDNMINLSEIELLNSLVSLGNIFE